MCARAQTRGEWLRVLAAGLLRRLRTDWAVERSPVPPPVFPTGVHPTHGVFVPGKGRPCVASHVGGARFRPVVQGVHGALGAHRAGANFRAFGSRNIRRCLALTLSDVWASRVPTHPPTQLHSLAFLRCWPRKDLPSGRPRQRKSRIAAATVVFLLRRIRLRGAENAFQAQVPFTNHGDRQAAANTEFRATVARGRFAQETPPATRQP